MSTERNLASALVVCCAIAAAGSWFTRHAGTPPPNAKGESRGQLAEKLFGDKAQIATLDVTGVIMEESGGGFGGGDTSSAKGFLKALDRIREDECKAILIKINSPGGSAAASAAIHDELLKLKKEKGVKIYASFGDMSASGGYYIASAADRIMAHPASLTGSIGVIMHLANYQGLMSKIGVSGVVIKSAPLKDIGSPDRPMTAQEKQILQSIIDDTYGQFLKAVSDGRKMPVAKVRPLADGRIFTGNQALKVGLVDELGNYKDAEVAVRKLAGLPADAKIKNYGEDEWQSILGKIIGKSTLDPLSKIVSGRRALVQSGAYDGVPLMLYE